MRGISKASLMSNEYSRALRRSSTTRRARAHLTIARREAAEVRGRERLGPQRRIDAAAFDLRFREQRLERIAQGLAPLREGGGDHAAQHRLIAQRKARPERGAQAGDGRP